MSDSTVTVSVLVGGYKNSNDFGYLSNNTNTKTMFYILCRPKKMYSYWLLSPWGQLDCVPEPIIVVS